MFRKTFPSVGLFPSENTQMVAVSFTNFITRTTLTGEKAALTGRIEKICAFELEIVGVLSFVDEYIAKN